jgi:hypothetical protein
MVADRRFPVLIPVEGAKWRSGNNEVTKQLNEGGWRRHKSI